MKLGLISDIHGDLAALLRAQYLLLEQHRVDGIWCAGDLVGRGKSPDEVVLHIIQGGMPAVLGNHDEMMISPMADGSLMGERLGMQANTLRLLAALPRTYRAQMDHRRLVMVHGTPRSNWERISPNPQEEGRALAWLEKVGADILITGHSHVPMAIQNAHGLVVNPGSLFDEQTQDDSRSSSKTYGVLEVGEMRFQTFPLWDS
jgi:putative phosphoesterase